MAHKKSAGTTKNGRDSNPKYLGIKVTPGSLTQSGAVLVRQRGTAILPGRNVRLGRDHTLMATSSGKVTLSYGRKIHFDNKIMKKKIMHVLPSLKS
jgi:large subunit ribosomal protein L27